MTKKPMSMQEMMMLKKKGMIKLRGKKKKLDVESKIEDKTEGMIEE